MQIIALLPILALLGTGAFARTSHPRAAGAHRRHLATQPHHARQVQAIVGVLDRREQVSAGTPRALAEKPIRRVKKRGASGCRPRSSSASLSTAAANTASSSSVEAPTTTLSSSTGAVSTTQETSTSSTEASTYAFVTVVEAYVPVAASTTSHSSAASTPSTTSSATPASTSKSSSSGSSSYTPNGIKAGIAGGDAFEEAKDYIGSWYDWNAVPQWHTGKPVALNMLWGAGTVDSTDASRLATFEAMTSTPEYIIGFEEPDCSTQGSANIGISTAAALWDSTIAPWKAKGSVLVSPSMCHQAAEQYIQWLAGFNSQISTPWDITNLHINKNSMDGVKADLDYYWNTYGKPIWVTEFACVDDSSSFIPCTDQNEINTYINDIVALFESDSRVMAYHYSNGEGLGDVWPMYRNGALSASGQTYINAIKAYA